MQIQLPLFLKWGIRFREAYEVAEQATRPVAYADRFELEQEILRRRDDFDTDEAEEASLPPAVRSSSTGRVHSPAPEQVMERNRPRRPPLRTD